jgi:hypothetical protein
MRGTCDLSILDYVASKFQECLYFERELVHDFTGKFAGREGQPTSESFQVTTSCITRSVRLQPSPVPHPEIHTRNPTGQGVR